MKKLTAKMGYFAAWNFGFHFVKKKHRMEKQDMRELLERIRFLTPKFDRELADAVLEVSIKANQEVVDELRGDDSMCQALLEIMEPEITKIRKADVQ